MIIHIEMGDLDATIGAMQQKALYAATSQALDDCNFYVPVRNWFLRNSSYGASDVENGHLVWRTPYARRRYYEPANLSKHPNPNASLRWAEVARDNHLDDWAKIAQKALGKP